MAGSYQFETLQLDEWRDRLRDINFWLDGYRVMEGNLVARTWVQWNVGVGPTACFTRAISSIIQDKKIRRRRPFDHVIEVDMKQARGLSFQDMLTIEVAEVLGLLDRQDYNRLKREDDEMRYYSYGVYGKTSSLRPQPGLHPQIFEKMSNKRYLLVVRNVHEPIMPIRLNHFTEGICLPPPSWNDSFWLVSTTSQDVYDESKPEEEYRCTIKAFSGDDLLMLTLYSLRQAANYILDSFSDKDEKYWHIVVLRCFHYAAMLLIPHCLSSRGGGGGQQSSISEPANITQDELIRQWASHGILPVIKQGDQERMEEVTHSYHHKYNDDDIYKIGNVILQAFREYSLLQLPFSPATEADAPTDTAAHFLVYSGLIAEHLSINELCGGSHPGIEHIRWISHVGDQGWHVSREWLSPVARGPTTLIIRHCSWESRLFAKLDPLLAISPCLCVLDLSYTPLISLPSSVIHLQNLQLLSLRGCYNLSNPFSFPNNKRITVPGKNSNSMIKLLYLDFSYSNVQSFDSDFFHNIPNLQELMLIRCSNLVELPHSISALSRLTTLELSGTEIKSFSEDMVGKMKKLRSLNLIDNKKLFLLPGLISKACDQLTNVHIEGWESSMEEEVKLEWHPTLRSFSLIGASHIKRLSLYGCRKLESVDIKELDALEDLNMSSTGIKELPVDIPNLPRLRRLLLMGVASLRRFPWHALRRLPDTFYLDQCSDGNSIRHSESQAAQVCISDSRFFYSFNLDTRNLVRRGEFFQSFYVRVSSCMARHRKMQDEEDTVFNKKPQVSVSTYTDVNHCYLTEGVSMVSMDDVPPFRRAERHVEISAVEQYPHGLKHLLEVTKSMSMTDDTHVSSLSDLSDFSELEECMLRRCHKMVDCFLDGRPVLTYNLRNACVSHLKSLTHFYRIRGALTHFHWTLGANVHFDALKHLRLEHCPRLKGVMPRRCGLPSLVTLDILFCYNLKAIFYDNDGFSSPRYQFPCLRRMHLQELPLLEHLHYDDASLTAPAWEELNVRGCWSLRRLPRLDQQPDKKAVEVSGERAWWAKLRWDRDGNGDGAPLHRGRYQPVLPPASASFRERVVIKSYLR